MDELDSSGRQKSAVIKLLQCISGPRLRRRYLLGSGNEGVRYQPNKMEHYASNVILAARLLWSLAVYTTPLYVVYYFMRYGLPSFTGVLSTVRNLAFVPISFSLAYIFRGVGRFRNQTYVEFLRALNAAKKLKTKIGPVEARMTGIGGYDFEMSAHPVTFRHNESNVKPRKITSPRRRGFLEWLTKVPISTVRFMAAHYVARRLIYPGSLEVFNMAVAEGLSTGRSLFKRKYDGHRGRLLAADGNSIDCMFVDRRGSPDVNAKGNKLVICCEGNAAYYELGIMEIPIRAMEKIGEYVPDFRNRGEKLGTGYSVLGWNHPGFADSSGLPFPSQEFNAVDVVVRYAVSELGFTFEDMILFAWSIGGYTASCAAMSYPEIGAVILDATFDDLYPLVQARIHPMLADFCHGMVREFFDLNIAEQMCRYPGPVLIVRRSLDEMMSVKSDVSTNRANFLLIKLLQNRYPNVATEHTLPSLWQWLRAETDTGRSAFTAGIHMNPSVCSAKLQSYMAEYGPSYPWTIGDGMTNPEKIELLIFLAEQYFLNYDSSHCVGLPWEYFRVPRNGNLLH